jgi:hypothetical protein
MAYIKPEERSVGDYSQFTLPEPSTLPVNPVTVPRDGIAEIGDGLIQSQGFKAGMTGWKMDGLGRAWFKDVNIGGRIVTLSAGQSLVDAITTLNAGGGGTINLKAGTYVVTSPITLKSSIKISGEDLSNTIITFAGTSANISCTGSSVYTTGTVTAFSGTTVTGSGTSWLTNATAGQHIFIGTRWYKIAAVTGNTTIITTEGYGDSVTFPSTYRIATITRGITIENLTITGSTGTALSIQDARQSQIDNVIFYANNKGVVLTNVSEFVATQIAPVSNTSNGMELTNCGLFDWGSINFISNGGAGVVMNNVKNINMTPLLSSGNTGDGMNITSATNLLIVGESSGNGGQGIELVATNDEVQIQNIRVVGNTSDGIKLTASSNNTRITAGKIANNGGYGVNVADSTSSFTNIVGNVFSSNALGACNDLGTSTVIRGNNGLSDNNNFGSGAVAATFTAQESLAASDSVIIGSGTDTVLKSSSTGNATTYVFGVSTTWYSQKFTSTAQAVSVKQVYLSLGDNFLNHSFTISIRANSAGQPTGADIGGYTATGAPNGVPVTVTFTFATPVPISPSTDYHIVIRALSTTGADTAHGNNTAGTGTNSSANSGSTWSASNGALQYGLYEIDTVSGQISKSKADISSNRANNFVGFTLAAVSMASASTVAVQTDGVFTGLSGLTPGSTYYLSDTAGAISASPGTVSRKVGIATSATSLFIKQDNS